MMLMNLNKPLDRIPALFYSATVVLYCLLMNNFYSWTYRVKKERSDSLREVTAIMLCTDGIVKQEPPWNGSSELVLIHITSAS